MVSAIGVVIILLAGVSAIRKNGRYPRGSATCYQQQVRLPRRPVFCSIGAYATASEMTAMVPFFVQFKCKLGQSYAVANALAEAEIASEIYSTAGDYDLLVKFYVDNDTDIGHFVNEKVQVIPGIQDTHTIITFKAFGTG
jgi:DNA-binding Lrp family transcriptional regulator